MERSDIDSKKIELLANFYNNIGVAACGGGVVAVMIVLSDFTQISAKIFAECGLLLLASLFSGIMFHLISRSVLDLAKNDG